MFNLYNILQCLCPKKLKKLITIEKYWEYQAPIGKVGGILNKFKFKDHILPENCVLDFGCGGGFLLNELNAAKKIGFEINESAREHAKTLGITMVNDLNDLKDGEVDIIISNHALEHVPNPLEVLKNLYRVVRTGGLIVIVIPCEQPGEVEFNYKNDDINQHLYSWCPQTIGNLVKLAGFSVEQSYTIRHKWTPDYQTAYTSSDYHERCKKYAIEKGNYQVKCIGRK